MGMSPKQGTLPCLLGLQGPILTKMTALPSSISLQFKNGEQGGIEFLRAVDLFSRLLPSPYFI